MQMEFENFFLEYTEKDKTYINEVINTLLQNQEMILNFFSLQKLSKKVSIKFWDDLEEYRNIRTKQLQKYSCQVPLWETASAGFNQNGSFINILSLSERRKCEGHERDGVEELIKVVLHEFTHVCHREYSPLSLQSTWFREALATSLTNQYPREKMNLNCSLEEIIDGKAKCIHYFSLGIYLLSEKGRDYILELSKDTNKLRQETKMIYEEAKEYILSQKNEIHEKKRR